MNIVINIAAALAAFFVLVIVMALTVRAILRQLHRAYDYDYAPQRDVLEIFGHLLGGGIVGLLLTAGMFFGLRAVLTGNLL